jgi:hypothetical protein
MANPVVTSIAFDKDAYNSGDTITATVKYTSPNTHGGGEEVSYNFNISLTDELTSASNSGVSGQGSSFLVNSGPLAPNPVDIAAAAGLTPVGIIGSSLTSGNDNTNPTSLTTESISTDGPALLALSVSTQGGSVASVSGLSLTWTQQGSTGPLGLWTAVTDQAVSGTVDITLSGGVNAAWDLDQISGVDLATPFVLPVATATGGGDAASITFPAPASGNNKYLFAVGTENGGYAPAPAESPAWEQLAGEAAETPGYGFPEAALGTQMSADVSNQVAAASWANYPNDSPSWGAIGLELNAFNNAISAELPVWSLVFNNLASDGTGTAVFEAVAP